MFVQVAKKVITTNANTMAVHAGAIRVKNGKFKNKMQEM